jgi:hypothetical protein
MESLKLLMPADTIDRLPSGNSGNPLTWWQDGDSPMSTITRELAKLFRKITNSEIDAEGNAHVVLSPADSLLINNARIALASLEAEAVCVIDQSNLDYLKSGSDADVWPASRTEMVCFCIAPPRQRRYLCLMSVISI